MIIKPDLTYKGNADLYRKMENIPGEQAMFNSAARVLTEFSQDYFKKNGVAIELLDICCGPAPIVGRLIPENAVPDHFIGECSETADKI